MMGDSRIRNIYSYFEFMYSNKCDSCDRNIHVSQNLTFQKDNFKIDFIWGPQTETGNQ